MRWRRFISAMLLLTATASLSAPPRQLTLADIDAALAARDAGNWHDFRVRMTAISARHPENPSFRFLLSQAQARTGNFGSAQDQLSWLADRGYGYAAASHPAFAGMKSDRTFKMVTAKLAKNAGIKIGTSRVILTFDRDDLRPEGIAFDPGTNQFLVGSTTMGAMFAVTTTGATTPLWVEPKSGIEIAGIRAIFDRPTQFAFCSNTIASTVTGSNLVVLDLATGQRAATLPLPRIDGGRTYCNDIAAFDGGLAITDSEAGMVWLVDRQHLAMKPAIEPGSLIYPNGIAAYSGGDLLFVADMLGLNVVSPGSGQVRRFESYNGISLAGIDGLYAVGGVLFGIQNTVSPERVIQITTSADGAPRSVRIIGQGQPELVGMTTAIVHDDRLIVLARTGIGGGQSRAERPLIVEVLLPSE